MHVAGTTCMHFISQAVVKTTTTATLLSTQDTPPVRINLEADPFLSFEHILGLAALQ